MFNTTLTREDLKKLKFKEERPHFSMRENMENKFNPIELYRHLSKKYKNIYFLIEEIKEEELIYSVWTKN